MKLYTHFIGIDIGKKQFVVHVIGKKETQFYENTFEGISTFLKDNRVSLQDGLCVLESTGGHETRLLLNLHQAGVATHRAAGRQVKSFIRSYGKQAKTDAIDAHMLALYAQERHASLTLFTPPSPQACQLYELAQRRKDLKQMLVMEKCRLQAPNIDWIKESIEVIITTLKSALEKIDEQIHTIVANHDVLKEKRDILLTVPGIGKTIADELLILLPELGTLNRREIASLVGLAPIARDSGQLQGYRRTGHGRMGIKPSLFLAAMAAARSKSSLKDYYESLLKRGKKKMVALTALMRKIIVIANARMKEIPC